MKYFPHAIIAIVAIAIIAGFFVVGSPQEKRLKDFDRQRVSHLQALQRHIVFYWQSKEVLPEDLSVLEDPLRGVSIPNDPETGEPYEYNQLGPLSFELCAEFDRPSDEQEPSFVYPEFGLAENFGQWPHDSGRTCFERVIDPDFFENDSAKVPPVRF